MYYILFYVKRVISVKHTTISNTTPICLSMCKWQYFTY